MFYKQERKEKRERRMKRKKRQERKQKDKAEKLKLNVKIKQNAIRINGSFPSAWIVCMALSVKIIRHFAWSLAETSFNKKRSFYLLKLTFFKLFLKVICVPVLSYSKSRTFHVQVVKCVFCICIYWNRFNKGTLTRNVSWVYRAARELWACEEVAEGSLSGTSPQSNTEGGQGTLENMFIFHPVFQANI